MDRIYILAKDWICDLDIYPTENFGSGSDTHIELMAHTPKW